MASPVKATFDIETNGLLNDSTIDYSSVPYKLKDSFKLHCIVVEWDGNIVAFHDGKKFIFDGREHHVTNEKGDVIFLLKDYTPVDYVHRPLEDFMKFVDWLPEGSTIIGHNIINFDLLALKLVFGLDYIVEKDMDWKAPLGDDYWGDKKVIFDDTMVRSKTLNPDRFGGHSLEKLAENLSFQKFDFRPSVPKEEKFEIFGADMVYYNIFDVLSNKAVAKKLDEEMKDFGWEDKWNPAIKLEKAVAELITRQEHRGFSFDKDLAERNVEELDSLMEERRRLIEPLIPPRPATKSFMKHYTPPKVQFKKSDGKPSANLLKFVNKLGATLVEDSVMVWEGKEYQLPLPQEPLVTTMPVTLNDTTHIKEWLVGLGWQPLEYKERDLTIDSKKNKLEGERLRAAVDRYLEQTLQSNFWKDRLEHFGLSAKNAKEGVKKLKKEIDRRLERGRGGVRVLTNPSFTVGVDKEICPNLEKLSEQREDLACILQVSEYLTYRHRRNSILGGGADWDEDEEHEKGYVTAIRSDGRIPTPADTCGAGTSRFKHRLVVNVPRSSSLFGDKMRAMFKADDKVAFQLGYDFSSLEARIEGHYCWSFETTDEKEYCHSLTLEKPNDVHSVMARRVSDIVGFNFERTPAKSTKYCVPMHTKVLTKSGWKLYNELVVGEELLTFNSETGMVEDDIILEKHFVPSQEVFSFANKLHSFQCTENHRWYGWKRRFSNGTRVKDFHWFEAKDFTTEHNLLLTAPWVGGSSSITAAEAKVVGLVLSDGYFKWSERGEGTACSYGRRKGVRFSIGQSSSKYWREVEDALEESNLEYKKTTLLVEGRHDFICYTIRAETAREFLDRVVGTREDKHDVNWTQWVQKLSREALESFYEGFYLGDGSKGTQEIIGQNSGNVFDGIVAAAQLLGRGRVTVNGKPHEKMKRLSVLKRKHLTMQEQQKTSVGVQDTFCITTKNGSFIIWQDSFVGITGNCLTYGGGPPKVAKIIGRSEHYGKMVSDAFWEAAWPLASLKEYMVEVWKRYDRKKIVGIDGRLIPTRSEHALVNSLFQSGGVICAKRTMVLHDRYLSEENLLVDFFKDVLDERHWAQQMIAMHDEAQMEVSKKSVKFERFSTEEEAKSFKDKEEAKGRIWSDVQESPKGGFFLAYCLAGELISKAVSQVTSDFKLNVPLEAGYMLGKSWDDCH